MCVCVCVCVYIYIYIYIYIYTHTYTYIGVMYFSKLWCTYLHPASTCEHARYNFFQFPQSHHNFSKWITNLYGGRMSLEFCVSCIKNIVLLMLKESNV